MVNPKPDNRKDNVGHIQEAINKTIRNMEAAEDMMERTDNPKTKEELQAKNERRAEALAGFRQEIKDEAKAREKGYQE